MKQYPVPGVGRPAMGARKPGRPSPPRLVFLPLRPFVRPRDASTVPQQTGAEHEEVDAVYEEERVVEVFVDEDVLGVLGGERGEDAPGDEAEGIIARSAAGEAFGSRFATDFDQLELFANPRQARRHWEAGNIVVEHVEVTVRGAEFHKAEVKLSLLTSHGS